MAKVALITGVTGQDGSYLAELLLRKGYEVHGVVRRTSSFATGRIDHLRKGFSASASPLQLHYGDLGDATGLRRIIEQTRPDEVYNLAAQSHVRISFDQPEYTADVVGLGALRLLETIRDHNKRHNRSVRYYQAGSSEMFGKAAEVPQRETTPFHPRSPYACAKCYAHWQTVNYREAYGLFATNGILFNHESPRRGENFVTRKITRSATRIKLGMQEQEFLELVFERLKLDWRKHVVSDPRYLRPSEVDVLIGDYSKARRILNWEPKVKFPELVELMVNADMELAERERRSLGR